MYYKTMTKSISTNSLTSFVTGKLRDDVRRADMFVPRELIQSARDGQIEKVHEQIHFIGRDKKKLNVKDGDQMTALHYAVRYRHLKIVKLLVLNGADVNSLGENGVTPLHYAARYMAKYEQSEARPNYEEPVTGSARKSRSSSGKKWTGTWSKASKVMKRKMSMPSLVSAVMGKSKQQNQPNQQMESSVESKTETKRSISADGLMKIEDASVGQGSKIDAIQRDSLKTLYKRSFSEPAVARLIITDNQKCSPINKVLESRSCDSLAEEAEEEEEESGEGETKKDVPLTLKQVVKIWKEKTLGDKGGYNYHYDDKDSTERSEKGVVISTDLEEADDPDVHNIDALILPTLRKETITSDGEVMSIRRRRSSTIVGRTCCNMLTLDDSLASQTLQRNKHRESTASAQTITTTASSELNQSTRSSPFTSTKDNASKDSIIKFLLKHNANVNAKDDFGSTPLHYAAMRGNVAAVQHLLNRKEINLEAKDGAMMTAMHIASSHGSLDVCKLLLSAGCEMNSYGHNKMSALHFAATEGHLEIAKLLVQKAENSDSVADIATVVHDQDIALHLAVENGHLDMVNFFIEQGANVNFVRGNFVSLLHTASRYGQLDIVRILVQSG